VAELVITPSARADLLAQWDYYAEEVGRPDLADRFTAQAEATCKKLARTPGLGRPRSFSHSRLQNLHSWKIDGFPSHLIFYRPLPDRTGVEILRILHGARDLEAHIR
jgi:plasmid stabilization system protein ParE